MTRSKFLHDLSALGFFRYTDPDLLEKEKAAILRVGWEGIFGDNGRLCPADAEELAEGGVSALISEVAPFLEANGVAVPPLEDDLGEEYFLIARDQRLTIWTRAEYDREDAGEPGLLWGLSAARTVMILNIWLEKVGSLERAYGVNGGNDFYVFFLTPELIARILRDAKPPRKSWPYAVDLRYPNFGQLEG